MLISAECFERPEALSVAGDAATGTRGAGGELAGLWNLRVCTRSHLVSLSWFQCAQPVARDLQGIQRQPVNPSIYQTARNSKHERKENAKLYRVVGHLSIPLSEAQ